MTVLLMLRSAAKESLRPQRQGHFGAQSHTPRNSCVRFAAGVAAGLAQYSPPGGLLALTWAGLSPADRASFLAHPLPALRIAAPHECAAHATLQLIGLERRRVKQLLDGD